MTADLFIYDLGVEDQLLGVIIQRFSCVLEFTAVETVDVNEFPDFCDELSGPFECRFFASYVSEIRLLCICEGFWNET